MGGGGEPAPFHSASLYVGDLATDANEALLFEIFNAVGPVASIRVCRDAVTRRSLGYAYVNYHQLSDAERALDTMNFSMIKSKPCRGVWSQRDPSGRRSGAGNIFVKNLHESIDNKQLYDTFSLFGNILSCKVVTDRETGGSKGYGYVHYETVEAANAAIEKLDGMLIDGQEVQVGHFIGRNQRPGQDDFTNCYVKNIPLDWDDERLNKEFAQFGEIASAAETDDKKIESLGFGFVNFVEHESAAASVEALNGKNYTHTIDGEEVEREMFVGRAQKKAERDREMRSKHEAEKMDRISKFQGVNLYVKNLEDVVTDDMLRDEFAAMGTITSARIMKDMGKDGRSRGFGFVCFSSPEEATRAVNEMNGKLIANKPIFVALAQRREVRRAQLEAQHANRNVGPGGPGQPGMMRGPMGGPMGYPGMPMYMQRGGPGGAMQPAYPMAMPQMMGPGGRGGQQRPGAYPQMMGQPGGRGYMPYGVMQQGRGRGGPMPQAGRGGPQSGRGRNAVQGRGPAGNQQIKFNQQARNAGAPPGPAQQPSQASQQMPAPEGALTASALASASPEMQKNMIGERLYPLIHQSQPELAGKITGMLLEMDNSELLHLLESPEALKHKIDEAIQVLEAHQSTD
ncbi:polyadenylate binding protein [Fragilariopsis cylindrus CCMP1102]|uniref:Polyadenylate-binding protein n=1 Tax=Fragilariopsis cylindrus CCMP1102 TaxID=635003 RepID=A0A1E7FQC9_9STRA|nr:polyadenylate binding protein [Fragilariopsis cylindrus CCMP1102]|eukprot:OEU20358.1 polyadenylate binding protein [Fragilariopsis cylindrus CCMP1102]